MTVHSELPKECRLSRDYELWVPCFYRHTVLSTLSRYIKALHTYLVSFSKRAQPLVDVTSQQREAETMFNKQWEAGEIEGWEEIRQKALAQAEGNGQGIWCSACMIHVPLSHVLILIFRSGQKLYSKQTVYDAHLTSKKHVKAAAKQVESGQVPPNPNGPSASHSATNGSGNGEDASSKQSKHRTAALLTHLSTKLLASLATVLTDTKSNVERRFSLTAREREQELIEQSTPKPAAAPTTASGEAAEEEEEEERIYNPLKLPLGWDGKPIPYWLYKLHGLGVEYRCEICSDHVYMGRYAASFMIISSVTGLIGLYRKNFDRHFQVKSPGI